MPNALKEYKKLGADIQADFKKYLKKRLEQPKVDSQKLHGSFKGHYKIKLRAKGYRLIYQVIDNELVVLVVKVGRRDKVYKL